MALVLLKERSQLWRAGGSNPNPNFDLRPYIRIYYEQTAQDKALLRTRVVTNYYMQFYSKTSGSVYGYDEGHYSNYIDNSNKGWVSYVKTFSWPAGYSLFYVGQTSSYIYHNQSTGKASFNYHLYNQYEGDIYSTGVSGTLSVPTIQTSFAVSISNFDLGQTPTITVGVTNTNYNYELRYNIGSLSGTIASNQTASTYIWEMDEDLKNDIREEMATTKTKTLTITCETYDVETSKGTKTATCTLTINEKPTITDLPTILELNSDIYSYNNLAEFVVKNLSSLKFTIEAQASYGTTISTYSVRANSEKIATSNSNEVVINDISTHIIDNEEKKVNFYVSVTDARGNTSEETLVTLLFIDYIKSDYINTECLVKRAEDFDYCDISLKGNFFDDLIGITENELTIGYKYKEKGSTEDYTIGATELTPVITDNTFTVSTTLEEIFDHTKNYEIVFNISDLIYTGTNMIKPFSSSEYVMCEYAEGVDFKNIFVKGDEIFPIGRGFIDFTDTDYSNYLGFTWEKTCIGRVPVGKDDTQTEFDTIEKTGGHKDMQQHYHLQYFTSQYGYRYPLVGLNGTGGNVEGAYNTTSVQSTTRPQIHSGNAGTGDSGNLQPYQVVNYWKRTA